MKMKYFAKHIVHSSDTNDRFTVQKMAALGESKGTNQSDQDDIVDFESDRSSNGGGGDDDNQSGGERADRVSMRYKSGGKLRKYPTVAQIKRMRCVFVGPLGERYYEITKPFDQYRANYTSGFADECLAYFVYQKNNANRRQLRDQQLPEVGSEITVRHAEDYEMKRRCHIEGLDVRPRSPVGLAVLEFLDTHWVQSQY